MTRAMVLRMCQRAVSRARTERRAHTASFQSIASPLVIFDQAKTNGLGTVLLNRANKRNALAESMVGSISKVLEKWEKCNQVSVVLITSASNAKAFSAGADIVSLSTQSKSGPLGKQRSIRYCRDIYRLVHMMATYQKPIVSLVDGFVMGGGAGLCMHSPFRVVTERTVFAMPEVQIGHIPDVGAGFFFTRLEGALGMYLALTGERLTGEDMFLSRLATHYVSSSSLPTIHQDLLSTPLPPGLGSTQQYHLINKIISAHSAPLPPPEDQRVLYYDVNARDIIDRCFSRESVEEIMIALEEESSPWAQETLERLRTVSPTMLLATFQQMRRGKSWSIADTFRHEYMMSNKTMSHPDFVAGVAARLLSSPRAIWNPDRRQEVKEEDVRAFFVDPDVTPLDLVRPAEDYYDYPWRHLELPSEAEIGSLFDSGMGVEETINFLRFEKNGKSGVREKVAHTARRYENLFWDSR